MSQTAFLAGILSLLVGTMTVEAQEKLLTDFSGKDVAGSWITVNDNVMGGRSKGGPSFSDDKLVFSGSTNTDGGGFSSIRTKPLALGLGEYDGLLVRLRGSARTFQFDLGTDGRISRRRVAFRAKFVPAEDWTEVRIPFTEFRPTFFGRVLEGEDAPVLSRDQIATIGFFIYDKLDGPFKLEVDWVKAYRKPVKKSKPAPPLVIPEEERARYLGFLAGRFGVAGKSTSMVENLKATSTSRGGLNFTVAPQSRIIAGGVDFLGRLEYLKMFQPAVFRSQFYSDMLALREAAETSIDFAQIVRGLETGDPVAGALALALWAEIDRLSPGTSRAVAIAIHSGERDDFQSIRKFVLERCQIDIAAGMKTVAAMNYLRSSFKSSPI